MSEPDERAVKAAAFLAQALALADDPAALAADLIPVERDSVLAVFAAELESSVGPAAFLIYAYNLAAKDGSGRERFEADLSTLRRAADLDAPGPRAVAHALAGDDGFLLATAPATLRALAGGTEAAPSSANGGRTRRGSHGLERAVAAGELLRLLRAADAGAAAWLTAVGDADDVGRTADEAELALFLLDEGSIRQLLLAVDRVLTAARRRPVPGGGGEIPPVLDA